MNRAVYVGGFLNGRATAEFVGESMIDFFNLEDVDVFTYSDAKKNPDQIRKAVVGRDVVTQSAGYTALKDTIPSIVYAFSPPVPTTRRHLVAKTLPKAVNMTRQSKTIDKIPLRNVAHFNAGAGAEFVVHPVANFKPFLNGEISRYNSIEMGAAAVKAGIRTELVFSTNDEYFRPTFEQLEYAEANGVVVGEVEGVHDQLVLAPARTLHKTLG
jgi:hypothetical protein